MSPVLKEKVMTGGVVTAIVAVLVVIIWALPIDVPRQARGRDMINSKGESVGTYTTACVDGVSYLVFSGRFIGGITPKLDRDGKVVSCTAQK